MTAITFDKTWNADETTITYVTSVTETSKELLYQIKTLMKNHNWTVVSSSNSSVADTNDNWSSRSNLVGATPGSAHSWIVLKNTAIASNFQVCFDLSSTTYYYMSCAVSYNSGFTGGTTTARPTATDEVIINSTINWSPGIALAGYSVVIFYSSDFKCNRIFFTPDNTDNGASSTMFIFDVPKDPVSWWDQPFVAGVRHKENTYTNLCVSATSNKLYTRINGTSCDLSFASWGTSSGPFGTLQYGSNMDYDGYFVLSPIPIISLTATRPGIIGLVYDLYWVGDNVAHKTYIPTSSGSKTLVVYNNLAQANDGSNRIG